MTPTIHASRSATANTKPARPTWIPTDWTARGSVGTDFQGVSRSTVSRSATTRLKMMNTAASTTSTTATTTVAWGDTTETTTKSERLGRRIVLGADPPPDLMQMLSHP